LGSTDGRRTSQVFEVKGIAGSGGRFHVGTIVKNEYGAPGVVIRILPGGDRALGPRAWVAYDLSARRRTLKPYRTPEGFAREMSEVVGQCEVRREYLYMLKPIGQAKRIPRCVLTTRPGYERPARGHWVKASRPPRRKTKRERRAEIEASLREQDRQRRQSRGRFPIYKAMPFEGAAGIAKVIESYERFAYWHRQYAKGKRDAIAKYNWKGALRRQYLAEARAEDRLAARAERVVARLRGHHLILEAHKAVR
jgi:hypothetical protein